MPHPFQGGMHSAVLVYALFLGVLLVRDAVGDAGQCGLRPPAEEVHPSDLNADGKTSSEEFMQYAKVCMRVFCSFCLVG